MYRFIVGKSKNILHSDSVDQQAFVIVKIWIAILSVVL